MKSISEIKEFVKGKLSEKRFKHTESVVKTAMSYGKGYELSNEELEKLETAAWLHDICKELKNQEQITLAKHFGIEIYDEDVSNPNLLHSRVGAAYVEEQFEIVDPLILNAIREHTFGGKDMSDLSMILYLADFTEPSRGDHCDPVREIIEEGEIEEAVFATMNFKMLHVLENDQMVHPLSVAARNSML